MKRWVQLPTHMSARASTHTQSVHVALCMCVRACVRMRSPRLVSLPAPALSLVRPEAQSMAHGHSLYILMRLQLLVRWLR
jgi:hypothetical protein